jgi:hypothetical protein
MNEATQDNRSVQRSTPPIRPLTALIEEFETAALALAAQIEKIRGLRASPDTPWKFHQ